MTCHWKWRLTDLTKVAFDPEQKIPTLSLPEAINESDDSPQAVDKSQGGHKNNLFGLSRRVEISIVVILIVTVLAAAGIGIGVGETNQKPKSIPTAASSSTQTNATRYMHQEYNPTTSS